MEAMKVGLIGPTDLRELSFLIGRPPEFLLAVATQIGRILAESEKVSEVWVNPDGGMLAAVAQAYKEHGGKKLVVLVPRRAFPWPLEHTRAHTAIADEIRCLPNWYRVNHAVVSKTDIVVCLGLSAETLMERLHQMGQPVQAMYSPSGHRHSGACPGESTSPGNRHEHCQSALLHRDHRGASRCVEREVDCREPVLLQ